MTSNSVKVFNLTNEIPIYVSFPKSQKMKINLNRVVKTIRDVVPEGLYCNTLQEIMIGDFDGLKKKNIDSGYESGIIYIGTDILNGSEEELIKNIIHEIGHVVEEEYDDFLFDNENVQIEFTDKRMKLFDSLKENGYDPKLNYFISADYNQDFDNYLMNEVGYDVISKLSSGYMIDPYAFTDLHEYIAMNFEKYAMGNTREVKNKSEVVYSYLNDLFTRG